MTASPSYCSIIWFLGLWWRLVNKMHYLSKTQKHVMLPSVHDKTKPQVQLLNFHTSTCLWDVAQVFGHSSWEITLVDSGFICTSVTGIYREAREGVCSETRGKISHSESPWPHPTPRRDRRPGTATICRRSLQHALTHEIPEVN
jgi:hypothetical protein